MFVIVTNIILFSCLLLWQLFKKKSITASCIVIALYTLVSIGGIFFLNDTEKVSNMSFLCAIYFFVITCIFFLPILKTTLCNKQIEINENSFLKKILYIYVLFAFISSIGYFTYIIEALTSGDWINLKQNAYNGEMGLPNGYIHVLARVVVNSLKYAVMVYGFASLTNDNKRFSESLFWIIMGFIPSIIADLASAYRGGILITFILLISLFFLFKSRINRDYIKYIKLFFIIVSLICTVLMIVISISRFEDGYVDSLFSYFGQSMVNYNYGIASKIHSLSGGKFFLGNLIGLSMDQIMVDSMYGIKTNNGEDLNTFIGIMLFDFGYVGTTLIAIFLSCFLVKFLKKNRLDLAKLYIYTFYLHFLINGAFHFPWNYAEQCIYTTFFYLILKKTNKIIFSRKF